MLFMCMIVLEWGIGKRKVESTRNRKPMKLLCYEAYLTKGEAMRREKYLKSSDGRKDIRKRIDYKFEK